MKRDRPRSPDLVWPGKRSVQSTRDEIAARANLIEIAGEPPVGRARDKLFRGDNRAVMHTLLADYEGAIDLVYLDPPFGTGGSFALSERAGGEGDEVPAYSDRWTDGLSEYLSTMLDQLHRTRALLSERGTLFVHCDWRVSHYLRCLLDEVFGPECFKNEIVWRYRRWPAKTRVFQRMHDVILWYGRTPDDRHAWTPQFEPLAASTLETWGTKRQVADFSSGRRKPSQTDEETPGAPMSDVWDIGIIAPIARERVGYPTQKPEALLRRVIEAASRPGDLVADFFAGSGTTLVVAEKLGRRWIGCDASPTAIHAARKRLAAIPSAAFEILTLEGDPAAPNAAPSITITASKGATDRSVRLDLAGDTSTVDYWAVDWDHDGHVFRNRWHASRRSARHSVVPHVEHAYADAATHRIAVRIASAGGHEREHVVTWTPERATERRRASDQPPE